MSEELLGQHEGWGTVEQVFEYFFSYNLKGISDCSKH